MPEYSVFRGAQTFESNFFQVTKDGQFSNIHKLPNVVTIGILASCPKMLLPDLMIIAREKQETTNRNLKSRALEITRLIPLDLVEIFVHDANKRQLKMQLPTGEKYYLQLLVREEKADFLFECWLRLIYLMRLASGKIKAPENLPGKEPERSPSREQVQHSAPKVKKVSVGKESPKIQPKLQERSPPKWTSGGFTSRASEQTSAADQPKNVREPDFEKKKRLSSRISSESNPIPVTLQKSKKEICLLQKTKMASPLQKNPQAIRNEDPAAASKANNPGRPKSPGTPFQGQSPQQNQPASRVEPKVYPMSVGAGPSQAVQRKSEVESEKQSFPINPSHLANKSQNSKSNKYSGNPSMILGNKTQASSNMSPEKGHLTSQNDTGQQVHRVTMSVGVETSHVICQTVAVGPSETVGANLSNLPNKLLNASKSHKDQCKTIGKMEMNRKQVPVARNKVKTALSTAKEKSTIKFVTLYSVLSSSLGRLKNSNKDGTKRMTPKTSKHVTISGVIAKSRKSIVLQEEKAGKTLGVGTSSVVGLISKEATYAVAKKDFPPSSQPQKSLSNDAIKPQTPLARESLLETDKVTKLGPPIVAKEPSITSQTPHKNTGVEQCRLGESRGF
ncbi:muscle M-line assembly protein unc-89-like [Ahaetulla prasina]|uniref:muscle M-line assembly protein unc-89-like n=1 Tax=Ahaetulla prasina TaxID=499056 RepID=UPI002647954F|nr:muscle M-line assembly protein unc-89-like [Ahaetulla prasina]